MNLSKIEKIIFSLLFFHVLFGVFVSWINPEYFQGTYVREDGLIEWLTVDALLIGVALSVQRMVNLKMKHGAWFFIGLLTTGLLFLFGAGEEVSWGQRIFNFKAPLFFILNNSQQETNFHNLIVNGVKLNKLVFGTILGVLICIYFLILPLVYRRSAPVTRIVNKFAIPVPRFFHVGCYLLLGLMAYLTNSGKKGELLEFGGSWIFLMMIMFPRNKKLFS